MNREKLIIEINKLINPYTKSNVDFKKFMTDVDINEDKINLEYKLLGDDGNLNKLFNRELIKLLKTELKFSSVKLTHPQDKTVLNNDKKLRIAANTKVLAIMSGKGGVGKSQATVNIARQLVADGKKVAIMDVDIYGYSIPKILDLYDIPPVENELIMPLVSKEGIEVISSQYFIENNENKAIIWRASLLNKLMAHFFQDVAWSQDLDFILLDLPPGTGDITLNIGTYVTDVDAILVTTSNPDAAHVALRSGLMARDINFNLLGVIENMSYYMHNSEKLAIFGSGGASHVSSELDIPIITQIPINKDSNKLKKYYSEVSEFIIKGSKYE